MYCISNSGREGVIEELGYLIWSHVIVGQAPGWHATIWKQRPIRGRSRPNVREVLHHQRLGLQLPAVGIRTTAESDTAATLYNRRRRDRYKYIDILGGVHPELLRESLATLSGTVYELAYLMASYDDVASIEIVKHHASCDVRKE